MFYLSSSEWTMRNMIIRVLVSLVLGCIIGLDRGSKRRVAGTKTNTVVCLGSTLVMLTAQYMEVMFPGMADMSRMAAQVISGVGFLGVGTIIISGHQVRGLTTAASLWTCACIGLAVGIGFIDGAVIICALMLFSLHVLPLLERLAYRRSRYLTLYLELNNNKAVLPIITYLKQEGIKIDNFDILKGKEKGDPSSVLVTLHVRNLKKINTYIDDMEQLEGVSAVESLFE